MKKLATALFATLVLTTGMAAMAETSTAPATQLLSAEQAMEILFGPAPMLAAIAEHQWTLMSGTCAKIRPVANHSDCNYFLCEQYGCGAPYHFDPVDCACYCSYMY